MKKLTRGKINAFLAKYATEARVLDIGAGGSEHLQFFPNRVTIDINPARNPQVVGDAQALPFPDESFDAVVCSEVFEHVPDLHAASSEMVRVLKPGGLIILTARFAFPVHDAPGDYWRVSPYALERLFSDLDEIVIEAETGPFGTIAVLLQRIIFQADFKGGRVMKAVVYMLALVIQKMDWFIVRQYGDIAKKEPVTFLLSSGIYFSGRKKATVF